VININNKEESSPRDSEHSSVDPHRNMQRPGLEPGILHLFTFRGEILVTRLLDQKKEDS
jgi:hypothetical protein